MTKNNFFAEAQKSASQNLKIRFFSPNKRRKLLPIPVFGHSFVLHLRLGRFSQKSQKMSRGTFFRYLMSKLKNSKII